MLLALTASPSFTLLTLFILLLPLHFHCLPHAFRATESHQSTRATRSSSSSSVQRRKGIYAMNAWLVISIVSIVVGVVGCMLAAFCFFMVHFLCLRDGSRSTATSVVRSPYVIREQPTGFRKGKSPTTTTKHTIHSESHKEDEDAPELQPLPAGSLNSLV